MKRVVIALALVLSASVVYGSFAPKANEPFSLLKKKKKGAFKQGQISIHIGMGIILKADYKDVDYTIFGANEIKKKLPFNMMFDYGVAPMLSMGLYMGFYGESITVTDNTDPGNVYGIENKFKQFGLRTTYHQYMDGKLDPYAVLTLGFNKCKGTAMSELKGNNVLLLNPYTGGFMWGIQAGANIYFTDNIGAYVEAGYGKWLPIINLGAAVKF